MFEKAIQNLPSSKYRMDKFAAVRTGESFFQETLNADDQIWVLTIGIKLETRYSLFVLEEDFLSRM